MIICIRRLFPTGCSKVGQRCARWAALRWAAPRWAAAGCGGARGARRPPVLSIQSHVVYGAAGNSAAVFPIRRLGVNVMALNTVQFSNHTQYGEWEGLATPDEQISKLVDGIHARGVLGSCDAVLSGYLGTAEQGAHVLSAVSRVRACNPKAMYVCDPVMGHPQKGCTVPGGVQAFHATQSAAAADVICPNLLELGILSAAIEHSPPDLTSLEAVVAAARGLIKRPLERRDSPLDCGRLVLVKHLAHAGRRPLEAFEMALVSPTDAWHVSTPLLEFDRPPVGTGDLTSALFTALLVRGGRAQGGVHALGRRRVRGSRLR